ncbi:MAG TPA: DUF6624 domain-containing protein [Bacteroidia bacterium]|jgi:hypothetical protein|nr:DUF6624 domain-containing protein [Bacteroidia bacterium]
MKTRITFIIWIFSVTISLGQDSRKYFQLTAKADSLYYAKDYKSSAMAFSSAFKLNNWNGLRDDRYNAACVWALAGYPDSAFFHLYFITTVMKYSDYQHISTDFDLKSLYNDFRWDSLIDQVKKNEDEAEAKLNKSLIKRLDTIYDTDQKYRRQIPNIEKKYGLNSKEMKAHWKIINEVDSINLVKIEEIVNEFGWLGKDIIGSKGNSTLFLVIQHANLITLKKYLPIIQDAVKKENASPTDLALLEDRIALGEGRKQIYGSQVIRDPKTHKWIIAPIEDEKNVDERRANIGLEPLENYAKNFGIEYTHP